MNMNLCEIHLDSSKVKHDGSRLIPFDMAYSVPSPTTLTSLKTSSFALPPPRPFRSLTNLPSPTSLYYTPILSHHGNPYPLYPPLSLTTGLSPTPPLLPYTLPFLISPYSRPHLDVSNVGSIFYKHLFSYDQVSSTIRTCCHGNDGLTLHVHVQ